MRISTAAATLSLPVSRLRYRPVLRRRLSTCFSLKAEVFSNSTGQFASIRDLSSNLVETICTRQGKDHGKKEAVKNSQAEWGRHIFNTFSTSLVASLLLPSEILAIPTPEEANPSSHIINNILLLDLDPNTAKLAIGFIGPFLSAYGFLFIARIVMSWYPKLPVGKFPYVLAYAPTEPVLAITRKVIPPLGGVDVTPVVWFGLLSFLNEILVGPQGLLVLLSQQV